MLEDIDVSPATRRIKQQHQPQQVRSVPSVELVEMGTESRFPVMSDFTSYFPIPLIPLDKSTLTLTLSLPAIRASSRLRETWSHCQLKGKEGRKKM